MSSIIEFPDIQNSFKKEMNKYLKTKNINQDDNIISNNDSFHFRKDS
jgi:hypothetical protein